MRRAGPDQDVLRFRPPLPPAKIAQAFERLSRERALHSLIRWTLPPAVLRSLLADAVPRRLAKELPPEVWAGIAASLALDSPLFGEVVAQALHDRLAWDREPDEAESERLCRERPLEALWMGAIAEGKLVRRAFPRLAAECLRAYRSSPACAPPSWDFMESILDLHARAMKELRQAEKAAEQAHRESEADRQRLEDLRDELKRLRREDSALRAEKAHAERRAAELAAEARRAGASEDLRRVEDLERRLRKAEKEREHLWHQLERVRTGARAPAAPSALEPRDESSPVERTPAAPIAISEDPNPRRRLVRVMLRRLLKKGKIGGSHTHADNVYRGVADHEKGLAKQAIDLLCREGYLLTKSTATDVHVSLSPNRIAEIRAIVAGEPVGSRLARFFEDQPGA